MAMSGVVSRTHHSKYKTLFNYRGPVSRGPEDRGQVFPFALVELDLRAWPDPFASNLPVRCIM